MSADQNHTVQLTIGFSVRKDCWLDSALQQDLGLGALALGGGHILEGIFGAFTPDRTPEEQAEREAIHS